MTPNDRLTLPHDGLVQLHDMPEAGHHHHVVIATRRPLEPKPASLFRPGEQSAWLTHDPGMTWPDRRGELLAGAILDRNGAVAFCFRTNAAARACLRRLAEGGR